MDTPKYQKSDPAILLLNEIDILLAQTRLMELYLKQAQATAANEHARLREQHESEITALRAELADKERQLQERPAVAAEPNLSAIVDQLQRELSENQQYISRRETAFQRSTGEIAALQGRIAQLTADHSAALSAGREANAIRESLGAEIAALNQELESNRREFSRQQLAAREIESGLREQLQSLQNQVAEKQAYATSAGGELGKAQQEIAALHAQLGSLQALQNELRTSAARELEEARGRFESELASLRAALAERDRSVLQSQTGLAEIERGLKSEIDTLRSELQQSHAALGLREGELRAAGAQVNALQQRISELELAHRQATAASTEIDILRRSLADEVVNLQHQVEVKEKELVNRYEAVTAVELALHGRIQALQQELARAKDASIAQESELQGQRAETAALQSRIAELERAQSRSGLIEAARQQLEDDLNRLRADLAQKEYLLAGRERAIGDLEARFGAEIDALHRQLEQERSAAAQSHDELLQARGELAAGREQHEAQLRHKDDELDSLRATAAGHSEQLSLQMTELQQRLTEHESTIAKLEERLAVENGALQEQLARERKTAVAAHDELARLQAELTASRERVDAQLKQKDDELDSLRAGAAGHAEQLSSRVEELQSQLVEAQLLAESRFSELDGLRAAVTQLNEQLGEQAANHAQALGVWQDSQARSSSEVAQLAAARDELLRSQSALEVQLDEARGADAGLRGEWQASRSRIAELEALLESSQSASARVEVERARLRSELEYLDALHKQFRTDAAQELAQVRDSLQSELSVLRGELQQKAWTLAQHQASVENLAQVHREQMRKLEARLSEQQPAVQQQSRELEQALTRANALQRQVEELRAALQQSQAAGARQAEQIRHEYAARLDTVNSLLAIKSAEMANSGAVRANVEESLRNDVSRLRGELQERSDALQRREDELNRVRAETTAAQNRLLQLESVSARSESDARASGEAKSALESELTALRHELEQRSSGEAQRKTAMEEMAGRRRELDQAQAQIAQLQSRIEELQITLQQSEFNARRSEELREEYEVRIAALNRDLGESAAQLQDRASANSDGERSLRNEIDRLIGEAQERNLILENRNDELVRVKNDLDALAKRFNQLEATARQADTSASGQVESMRTEHQARLAQLQAELSQKQWALEERQALIAGLEQVHRQQLEALHQQLAEKAPSALPGYDAFVMANPNLADSGRGKPDKLEDIAGAIDSNGDAGSTAARGRRWQSGFGWKRRWRS